MTTCIDIHNQDEYDARKDDKGACLHLVAGYYPVISGRVGRVTGSGSVGRVDGSGSVEWVDGSGSVEWVDGSGSVEWVTGSGSVEAAGTSVVHAYSGTVKAGKYATVYQHGDEAAITGGNVIKAPAVETLSPAEWAEYSGVQLEGGTLTVYKAVDEDLVSGERLRALRAEQGAQRVAATPQDPRPSGLSYGGQTDAT